MPKARGLPLLLLVMLPSLQLSLAATRRRQIEDLSSEVENLGEAEGVDDKAAEDVEDEVETVTFNGHGNRAEDFWDHVTDNSTDVEQEDVFREIEEQGTGELKEDNTRSREPSEIPRVLLDECPRLSRCVGRNFCNSAMMITKKRENRLTFSSDHRGFLACVLPPGNNLGVCCMDVEEIVKGIDPGLQDVFLEKVVEEVTEVLNSNAIRTEESREEDVISVELGGEEFDVDEVDIPEEDDLFVDKTALPEEAEINVNEDENKVTITLRDKDVGDGGTAKEVLDDEPALADLEPLVEINLNVLRTRSDLAKAMKVNRDPKSRVRFVSQSSSDEVDYLDFDNDYIVITLENDYDYDSFLRASQGQLRTPRRRRPLRSRRPQARRVFIRG